MQTFATLDQPLPVELTGSAHGWFTRYRRYPVFSAPWARGRIRSGLIALALVMFSVIASTLFNAPDLQPLAGLLQLLLQLALPLVAGPWLGHAVRAQGWAPRREGSVLVAVILGLVVLTTTLQLTLAEPMKQWLAERLGAVDADGKRKRFVLVVGVNISATGDAAGAGPGMAKRDPLDDTTLSAINIATGTLLSFLLAGGVALRGWKLEVVALRRLQQERELAHAQAERREAELRLSVLAAQVEPHFLFNTLAGVRSAISTDPGCASEMIDRLVEYLRAAIPRLRSDGAAQVTVAGQVEIVHAYLALMSARMPRLHFSVQVPAELALARCPPLMLISLAENAVKHGVEPKIGAAHIELRAEQNGEKQLRLTVLDDGVGFGVSQAGSGLGLTNIRERLLQLYKDRASLTLTARPLGGVEAAITLPLEFDHPSA